MTWIHELIAYDYIKERTYLGYEIRHWTGVKNSNIQKLGNGLNMITLE